MTKSLKTQIGRDARRVFLNLKDFAVLKTLLYYRNGNSKPPEERRIPIVVDEDSNNNNVWNRNKTHTRMGNDQILYKMGICFFCALEDFNPPPKKGRRMELDGTTYEVIGHTNDYGILKVELRELEE